MADKPNPPRPTGPRMSHLQSDPVPFSLASPQQIAQYMAAASGGYHPRPQMKATTSQMPTQMMSTMHSANETPYHTKPVPMIPAVSAAAAPEVPKQFKPLPAQSIDLDTFKGFDFLSNDALQYETREVYDNISGTWQWVICNGQEDACIKAVHDRPNKRIFLVSTGGAGRTIVPKIHDLPQLYAVYIYCVDVKGHSQWAKDYSKVRIVCDNDDRDLLPLFAVDVAQSNIDLGNAYLAKGNRVEAKTCFETAEKKLNNHARNHDSAIDSEVKSKLAECK